MNTPLLLTPGPVTVDDAVLETASEPVTVHYGKEWVAFYNGLVEDLQAIFQTRSDMYLVTGPGTASLEMGLSSIAAAGETIIVVNNGFFGRRLAEIASAYGIEVVEVEAPGHERVGADHIGSALDDHPGAVAVAVVHHDTTTGVQNDVAAIARLAHERGAICMVDAISSLGGINLPVDEWGVDICVAVANKCLGGLPGISPITISPRAWEVVSSKETHNWYLNLRVWRWYVENWGDWHPFPTTVATTTVRALATAVKAILDEGLPAVFARHQQVAASVRSGLRDLGFEMLLPEGESSAVLTTAFGLPGMDIADFSEWLLHEKGLMISRGLGALAGKVFRVGHMGKAAQPEAAQQFLGAVGEYLKVHA